MRFDELQIGDKFFLNKVDVDTFAINPNGFLVPCVRQNGVMKDGLTFNASDNCKEKTEWCYMTVEPGKKVFLVEPIGLVIE